MFIETSPFNRTKVMMFETGTDTGIFNSRIAISTNDTLEYRRIQSFEGETVTLIYLDKINENGQAIFTIKAKKRSGMETVSFSIDEIEEEAIVTVTLMK